MSLLKGLTPPVKVRVCTVSERAKELGKEDGEILLNLMQDPAWSINALVAALGSRGVILSRTVIERHRGKRCPCSKI
jgi:hypothetical protein